LTLTINICYVSSTHDSQTNRRVIHGEQGKDQADEEAHSRDCGEIDAGGRTADAAHKHTPVVVAASPAEPAPLARPPAAALVLLERAMSALQQKDYRRAAEILRGILENHTSEGTLLDRVRVYLSLCEREMKRQPVTPRTIEERLTAATLALNNRLDEDAGRLAQSVLDEDADQDLARYLLAAVAARRGRSDEALRHLEEAIRLNPDARVQARLDDDFETLRFLEAFNTLIELPSHPALQRRGRRTR
jgi:tetratricopeptide (TPR) repeat protein